MAGFAVTTEGRGAGKCGHPLKSRRSKKATGSWRLSFVALCGRSRVGAPPSTYPESDAIDQHAAGGRPRNSGTAAPGSRRGGPGHPDIPESLLGQRHPAFPCSIQRAPSSKSDLSIVWLRARPRSRKRADLRAHQVGRHLAPRPLPSHPARLPRGREAPPLACGWAGPQLRWGASPDARIPPLQHPAISGFPS